MGGRTAWAVEHDQDPRTIAVKVVLTEIIVLASPCILILNIGTYHVIL